MDPLGFFLTFLRASAVSVGGQSSLPVLRQELVVPGLISDASIVDALTIGRLGTGPTGLYIVSLGYFAGGWLGAALSLVAVTLPPLVMVPAAAALRRGLLSRWFAGGVRGLTIGTSGLVVSTTILLMFPGGVPYRWWQFALVAIGTIVGIDGHAHPAIFIGLGALAGLALAG